MRYIFCIAISFILTIYIVTSKFFKIAYRPDEAEVTKVHVLNSFLSYMKVFNKSYTDREFVRRLRNYEKSVQEIARLNSIHGSNVFGPTKFTDWADEEFSTSMLSGRKVGGECHEICQECSPKRQNSKECTTSEKYTFKHYNHHVTYRTYGNILPLKFDWREFGVVFPVLDQKYCAACWAISIVGVMESMQAIQGKGRTRLSIQELIDCSTYNNGCHMGDIKLALQFLCGNDYPIVTEKEYPLKLSYQTCRILDDHKPKGRRIANYANLCFVNETTILKLIAKHGPVVASVNASPWRNYIGGVIKTSCIGTWHYLNHVVQIVGYDLTDDIPHYIIRNSWGKDFGDNGYVKVALGGNVCGIESNIAYFNVY